MKTDHKTNLIHRLKIAHGHLEKVIKMVSEDRYCLDIIQQTQAVEMALKKVDEMILENHLKTCVRESIKSGKGIDEKVAEVIKVFRRK